MIVTFRRALLPAMAMMLTLFILNPAGAEDMPKRGGTLLYGIESDIPWMDPQIVFGGSNKRVVKMAFEGLVDRDRSRDDRTPPLVGVLATSWDILDNGKTYRFKLRQGVKFHDGTDFNADAVAFNFRRIIDPGFEFYFKQTEPLRNGPLKFVDNVNVVDANTVDVVLKQPWAPFLDQLSTTLSSGMPLMVSPAAIKKYGNEGFNLHPVGTGPFRIVSYGPGVATVLERNRDYWNPSVPYLDKVGFIVLPEAATRVAALESGEVDMITALPIDRIDALKSEGFQIVMPKAMNLVWFISLNVGSGPLADVRVRQAINYAIDRDSITNDLLGGAAAKISAMVPGTSPLAQTDLSTAYPYDLDKAKQLMKEAGYENGFTVTAQLPTGGSYMLDPVSIMQRVQSDLGQIGIKVNLQTYDWVSYLQYWVKGLTPEVGMNVMSWGTDYSEWWMNDIATSTGFGNTGHIHDPEIDQKFTQYQTVQDPSELGKLAYGMFKRISDQAYFVPIASDRAPIAMAAKVRGVKPVPDWMQDFTQYWVEQ